MSHRNAAIARRGVGSGLLLALLFATLVACGSPARAATAVPPTANTAPTRATPQASPSPVATTRTPGTPAAPTAGATATRPTGPGTPVGADRGTLVVLRVGAATTLPTEGLTLRFADVLNESRCPQSVGQQVIACAHAGWATIAIEATHGAVTESLELQIPGLTDDTTRLPNPRGAVASFAGYRVQLVSLNPQPDVNHRPSPREYEATLLIIAP